MLALLPRRFQPAPVPNDHLQHEAERMKETAAMLAGLSCCDFARTTVGGALGQMLARLGAAIDGAERESHDDPQTLQHFYKPTRMAMDQVL